MLRITGAFDNSPQSEHNPAPSQLVNWGPQLQDEMFLGGIHFAETLTVRTQPRSQNVSRGGQANFSVSATSPNGPIRYQWRLNGSALVGATNSSFIITNAQPIHEGAYSVAVSDQAETLTSQSALLAVGDGPVITQHPQSQTAHAGDTVTFRVTATGTLPLSYRWRKDNVTLLTTTNNDTTATLTLTNVQTINAGTYSVGVFNLFGNAPVSSNAVLTVLTP
jgi:plastocyanin